MKILLMACALVVSAMVVAQPQDGLKRTPKPQTRAVAATGPVTRAEMKAAFAKIEKALTGLPGLTTRKPPIKTQASGAATRTEIILQMDRLFQMAEPHFKFTPPKVKVDAARITVKEAGPRKALDRLIAFGAIARFGPLGTSTKPGLELKEFGDALGFFTARMAELTHTPHPRWTPGMMDRMEDINPGMGKRKTGN